MGRGFRVVQMVLINDIPLGARQGAYVNSGERLRRFAPLGLLFIFCSHCPYSWGFRVGRLYQWNLCLEWAIKILKLHVGLEHPQNVCVCVCVCVFFKMCAYKCLYSCMKSRHLIAIIPPPPPSHSEWISAPGTLGKAKQKLWKRPSVTYMYTCTTPMIAGPCNCLPFCTENINQLNTSLPIGSKLQNLLELNIYIQYTLK